MASTARPGSANIISPTFLLILRSSSWPVPSRPAGVCEQGHQQLKKELDLDHFEGRSWTGLYRHALMTMIAYAFLQSVASTRREKKKRNSRTSSATS